MKLSGWAKYPIIKAKVFYPRNIEDLINKIRDKNAIANEISRVEAGSFLAVLKRFGDQDSAFSFPMKGYTLALDFPINDQNLKLMNRLDEITLKYNGRFYLAKDSRLNKLTFQKSETRIENFRNFRIKDECFKVFRSSQSQRLEL